MKQRIKLLVGLLVLIIAGLYGAKYSLKLKYDSIEKDNPYYAFKTIENLEFSHVKIQGGNRRHIIVEPGEQSNLLISSVIVDKVSYESKNDTLYLDFTDNVTITDGGENYWGDRNQSDVYIQAPLIESVTGHNASIGVDMGETNHFSGLISGNTNLDIMNAGKKLQTLQIESYGASKFRVNQNGEPTSIPYIGLNLNEESLAELYNIAPDSTFLKLDSTSRISADATFFKPKL